MHKTNKNIQYIDKPKALSWNWPSYDSFQKDLSIIGQSGFQGVELVFGAGFLDISQKSLTQAYIKKITNAIINESLYIPSIRGGPFFWNNFASPHKKERDNACDYAKHAFDFLASVDGKVCLIVPGGKRKDCSYENHWKFATETSLKLSEIAYERGLTIAFENVEAGFLLSVLEWKKFLEEITLSSTYNNIGMYLDVGNVTWLDLGFPEQWLYELSQYIKQIHFKDAYVRGTQTPLLDGDVDWFSVSKAISDIKYKDWIAVEPLKLPKYALNQYLSFLAKAMDEIFILSQN